MPARRWHAASALWLVARRYRIFLGQLCLPGLPVASPPVACSVRAVACRRVTIRCSRVCPGCRLPARQWLAALALGLAAGSMLGFIILGQLCLPGLPVASQPGACSVRAVACPPPVLFNLGAAVPARAAGCQPPRWLAASALGLAAVSYFFPAMQRSAFVPDAVAYDAAVSACEQDQQSQQSLPPFRARQRPAIVSDVLAVPGVRIGGREAPAACGREAVAGSRHVKLLYIYIVVYIVACFIRGVSVLI